MENSLKKIPDFQNEDEEREFWLQNDSTEFIDWDKAETLILENLKPTKISREETMITSQ